ncbi:TPM domain-containing protein [Sphingomonas sp. KR1UV-12]|uniref:TPM domain-containing protein n=1 Tax=Sphingomonas aurea TaxID=3063994 RepID=A0ABT9EM68_9SPHN|nr:TPM domain-containing protein [Sphingomonas sp. KR1UV-12]MDP1027883.1 TPM domain-containing protein [Sphingomonas sp. KR1UV-12]
MILWRFAVALLLLVAGSAASAQTFPKFTGLVVDAANVLPPDVEASLTAKLEALQKTQHRQLVVVTVPDTQGYPLEDYGYRLGREWGVGLRDVNNGAILFAAPGNPAGQRGPRIEVGRGLEPVLTDAMSSVIVRQTMMPLIRADQVPQAFVAGTDAIIAQLSASPDEAKARTDAAAAEFDKTHRRGSAGGGDVPLGLIFWGMVMAFALLSFARHRGGRGRRYRSEDGGSGVLPIVLWGIANEIGRRGGGGGWGDSGGSGWGGGGGGGSDGSWGGGGFTGGGGGDFGGGGASGDW